MDLSRFENSPVGNLVPLRGFDTRTGREYDHAAFVPTPLDAEPTLSAATWREVAAANRSLARLNQAGRQVPNPALLLRPTLRREAQSTSALEGTFAPLEVVLAKEESDPDNSAEVAEVLNYVTAADRAFGEVLGRNRIGTGTLENTHKHLVSGTSSETMDAGKIRSVPVAIGSPNGSVEAARFVPMPPGIELNAGVHDLVRWINTPPSPRDPLIAAALAHYQFETLHPFNDGNGRIGRLLIVLQFLIDGLLSEPLLSVSPWFEARRMNYQEHLANVSATGDWDAWVQFFASGIADSADDTLQRINSMLAIQKRNTEIVRNAGLTGLARDIAEHLIAEPIVTVPRLQKRFGKSHQSTNNAVNRLVDLGLLTSPVGTYNRQFISQPVLQILTAPMGRVPADF